MNHIYSSFHQTNTLIACFTTRHGGISHFPYTSNNLAFHVGDNVHNVLANHNLLANKLGYERSKLIHMRQIHSDTIICVDDGMLNFDTPPQCDALITNRPNIPLMVMSADCTPILLYDPIRSSIAAVHAGRAGALNSILPKTIHKMEELYGTDPNDLLITLGPSIHGCCYEINTAIAEDTIKKGYANALHTEGEKLFLDVNTILEKQLDLLHIPQNHREIINHCTSCQCDTYFSYRAENQQTGRIAGVIMIR